MQEEALPLISDSALQTALGADILGLIDAIAQAAEEMQLPVALVGGVVRDLLLARETTDLDFVVETHTFGTDTYALAQSLAARYGGIAEQHSIFGTAKWLPGSTALTADAGSTSQMHGTVIDFASARTETYAQPAALPTVAPGTLQQDLARRDFTINTLAVSITSASGARPVIDRFGGLHDLQAGIIRVLHPASFRDDPTRLVRAARFSTRFGFPLAPETSALITPALPALAKTTGERLRNELTRLLAEEAPERGLRLLESWDVLKTIHPAFGLPAALEHDFEAARAPEFFTPLKLPTPDDPTALLWHLLAAHLPSAMSAAWAKRLLFDGRLASSLIQTNRLHSESWTSWNDSAIIARFEGLSDEALCALYLLRPEYRPLLIAFATRWRRFHIHTDGQTLQARGLRPGPCYRTIFARLHNAWIEGEITSQAEEAALLDRLIATGLCAEQEL